MGNGLLFLRNKVRAIQRRLGAAGLVAVNCRALPLMS